MKHRIVVAVLVASITAVVLVTAAVLIALSFKTIDANNMGVRYKTSDKTRLAGNKTYASGMRWAGLGYSFFLYPSINVTIEPIGIPCKTSDNETVLFKFAWIYNLVAEDLHEYFYQHGPWNNTIIDNIGAAYAPTIAQQYTIANLQTISGQTDAKAKFVAGFPKLMADHHANLVVVDFRGISFP